MPPHLKTVAIPLIQDQSGFGDPALKDEFSNELVRLFTNDNTLSLTDRDNADSVLDVVIVRVTEAPVVVNPGEQVAQRRLTVTARVTFSDIKLRKKVYEKDISQWGDYPSGGGLSQRAAGMTEAIRKLTEDILNETVAGW
ncbi:MAG: LptE family protein [Bacteroidota bacterium]